LIFELQFDYCQELGDFKLELEADNRGITEILEKNSLEMDQPTLCSHKENRVPKRVMISILIQSFI